MTQNFVKLEKACTFIWMNIPTLSHDFRNNGKWQKQSMRSKFELEMYVYLKEILVVFGECCTVFLVNKLADSHHSTLSVLDWHT